MSTALTIHWFRQDLRLSDNPSLAAAAQQGQVLPVYIIDDQPAGEWSMGAASRCWLHRSLQTLNDSLHGKLQVYSGDPERILQTLVQQFAVTAVHWNRCYEPWRRQRDQQLKAHLRAQGLTVRSFNGSLLWEPWQIAKADGTPYQVFTPFYRNACTLAPAPRLPIAAPDKLLLPEHLPDADIDRLALWPKQPWAERLLAPWSVGEAAAQQRLQAFLQDGIDDYQQGRDFPARASVSRLSPYLHFGEISAHQVWYAVQDRPLDAPREHFCRELAWREFAHSLLYQHPQLPEQPLQTKFERFEWLDNHAHLKRWQQGQTGIPLIDAGMRELWQTGYMHNRVRMLVGSFLVKNLRLPWQAGERWFWQCLLDADLANNSASWQWVAGCGADAAPYFRIFNAVTQGQKFDAKGEYTRRYVPELQAMPDKYLFNPWKAPATVLQAAGVRLGQHYPRPLVDLQATRVQALQAFAGLRSAGVEGET